MHLPKATVFGQDTCQLPPPGGGGGVGGEAFYFCKAACKPLRTPRTPDPAGRPPSGPAVIQTQVPYVRICWSGMLASSDPKEIQKKALKTEPSGKVYDEV